MSTTIVDHIQTVALTSQRPIVEQVQHEVDAAIDALLPDVSNVNKEVSSLNPTSSSIITVHRFTTTLNLLGTSTTPTKHSATSSNHILSKPRATRMVSQRHLSRVPRPEREAGPSTSTQNSTPCRASVTPAGTTSSPLPAS